jgi:dimethylsulfoniopropionate demethylase
VGPGSPNGIERVEAGLLSYGTDMNEGHTPFDCGLDAYIDLDADVESLSLAALKAKAQSQTVQLVGLIFKSPLQLESLVNVNGGFDVFDDSQCIGEITSQVWSLRYQKHLAFAMLDKKYCDGHKQLIVAGQTGSICAIPFLKNALLA